MSETNSSKTPLSQRQRWLAYGFNVVVSCLVAIALAILVIYAAQRRPKRLDTTAQGLYSLKPQTLNILKDINAPIRIVSLYTHEKPPQNPDEDDQSQQSIVPPDEAAQTTNDLLEEYANKGRNITVETIDPVTSPTKADDLIEEVEAKYGGEVKKYSDFDLSFDKTIKKINDIAAPEVQAINTLLPNVNNPDQDLLQTLKEVYVTVDQLPKNLGDLQDSLQRPLKQKPPDYKGAADAITSGLTTLDQFLGAIVTNFGVLQKRGGLPANVSDYMKTSLPHFQEMQKVVDDSLAQAKGLGELKLDTLRTALRERNTILVMGEKDWRAISYEQVWQPAARTAGMLSDTPPRPRFAGEQQVTAAILAVGSGSAKPKIAIVRAGGEPLTQSMNFMSGQPPMADAAARLQLYNFDIVEKDLTGQYAQQSGGTEPSDDDIKDATWIVWGFSGAQQSQFGPPPSIAPQVAAHLAAGGSAVILTGARQDAMAEALAPWGVTVRVDEVVAHEHISDAGGDSSDLLQQVLRLPPVFDLHEYGAHALTRPLNGLEGLFAYMSPVIITPTKGFVATPLMQIPTAPESPTSGATSDMDAIEQNQPFTFDPSVSPPIYAGAAVEKFGAGRLVVLGAGNFAENQWLELTQQQIDPNAPPVLSFPANGELFTNAVFWAAHQDTLIDISPASMDVGRIQNISAGMLNFWRVGVLLVGLPVLVLLSGLGVYLKRRD